MKGFKGNNRKIDNKLILCFLKVHLLPLNRQKRADIIKLISTLHADVRDRLPGKGGIASTKMHLLLGIGLWWWNTMNKPSGRSSICHRSGNGTPLANFRVVMADETPFLYSLMDYITDVSSHFQHASSRPSARMKAVCGADMNHYSTFTQR